MQREKKEIPVRLREQYFQMRKNILTREAVIVAAGC